ncbi:DUF6474 family protein [Pseudonocardia phyllosphaerae]|uniref:DUF6474 family protein n=1 Tax=Pseudonocardia phyllosphaerae TaxID=3390502 RepID=UPI003978051D
MGLRRTKPDTGGRAASATLEVKAAEAATDASVRTPQAVADAARKLQDATASTRVRADKSAEKLQSKASKARKKAEAANKRAEKAGKKAGRKARKAGSGPAEAKAKATAADRKVRQKAAKADAGARKAEAKAAQAQEKGRVKSEQLAIKEIEKERAAKEWNAARVKRYLGIAKILAPVLAPYAIAAAGSARHRWDDHRSRQLGVAPHEVGTYSGTGGKLHARMSRMSRTIDELRNDGTVDRDPKAKKFADESETRLHDLAAAVRTAEQMPATRRKAAFRAVSTDLDRMEVDLLEHLGVQP